MQRLVNGQTRHKQVTIEWEDKRAEVDEELAPLILALWKLDISTILSCQENSPGIAWIAFYSPDDAKKFLDVVAVYRNEDDLRSVDGGLYDGDQPIWESLYGRITGEVSDDDWQYSLLLEDLSVEDEIVNGEIVETCTGPSDFQF